MEKMNIVKLDAGHAFGLDGRAMALANTPMENVANLDQYELSHESLRDFNVLIVTDFIDQEFLFEHRDVIEAFLNDGKIVMACTHVFRNWLPGVNPFMPKMIYKHSDYEMQIVKEDSVFRGVDMQELAYRKGVSGFYARGYHPLTNKNAEVWLEFKDGTPITYVDRTTTSGTILAHAARDFLTYSTGDNTTKLISPQTLEWLSHELDRLAKEQQA